MGSSKHLKHEALLRRFKEQAFNDSKLQTPHSISIPFSEQVINPWSLWHGNLDAEIMLALEV